MSIQLVLLAQVRWQFLLIVGVHFMGGCGLFQPWCLLRRMVIQLKMLSCNVLTQSCRSFQLLSFQLTLRFFPFPATLVSQLTSVRLLLFMFQLLLLLLLQLLFFSKLFLLRYPLLLNVPLGILSFLEFLHLFLLKQFLLLLQNHDLLLRIVFVVQYISRL